MFKRLFSAAAAAAATLLTSAPATALTPQQLTQKLDTILVFMPAQDGNPRAFDYELDGEKRSVYFAAFSPAAINEILKNKIGPKNPELVKELKFQPASLAKFDSLVQPELKRNLNARVVYVPDPDQAQITRELLSEQGLDSVQINQILASVPVVFCPKPSLLATAGSGPLAGQSFVPCSTDYNTLKSLMDKSIAANPDVAAQNPKVVAIILPQFIQNLSQASSEDVDKIRVLPTPSSVGLLNDARNNSPAN